MRPNSTAELIFEVPPVLSWPIERRLSGRAVAIWEASCEQGRLPAAAGFERSELALFCAESSVGLVAAEDGTAVARVGGLVTAAFGLARGKLTDAGPALGVELARAFAELCQLSAPVSFEASLAGSEPAALLLTRGVVLPLLDAAGALTRALAIVTWKEVLGETERDCLYSELGSAVAAGRAARRLPGSLHAAVGKHAGRGDVFDRRLDRKPHAG